MVDALERLRRGSADKAGSTGVVADDAADGEVD